MKNASVNKTVHIFAAGAIALGSLLAIGGNANAFQLEQEAAPKPATVMAYANTNFDARFGSTPDYNESADHELNDAWLGMSVSAENGETLGYVVDALIGPDGQVTDLVITDDPNSDVEVFIPARLATLTDTDVKLALGPNDVAALRTAYNSAMASAN